MDGPILCAKRLILSITPLHIDLNLIFEKSSLKNQVGQIDFLSISNLNLQTTQTVQNRQKIEFVKLDFSNSIFQKSIADQ